MIYIENYDSVHVDNHVMGIKLLSYGLMIEKNIRYQDEEIVFNDWGKPSMKNYPDIFYNISHCRNYVACVISDTHIVGVDVEDIRDFSPYAARKVCTKKEIDSIKKSPNQNREFFRYWTLKESYIKGIGMGLSYSMKKANFNIRSKEAIKTNLTDCNFLLLENHDYVTSVCYKKL